jgi:hypothetical protein
VAYLGRWFNGLVIAKRDDLGAGLQALRGGLEQAGDVRFLPRAFCFYSATGGVSRPG